jgi:hypothetical protein
MSYSVSIKTGAVVVSMACLILMFVSIQEMRANTYFLEAKRLINVIEGSYPVEANTLEAKKLIGLAERISVINHADILDTAGRIDFILSIYQTDPYERDHLLRTARNYHYQALDLRKAWGYSVVNILYASSALGEIDDQFSSEFSRAFSLAPDDENLIKDLIHLGVKNWNDLPEKNQAETIQLLEASLHRRVFKKDTLKALLINNGQFHRLCSRLKQTPKKLELCNQISS